MMNDILKIFKTTTAIFIGITIIVPIITIGGYYVFYLMEYTTDFIYYVNSFF